MPGRKLSRCLNIEILYAYLLSGIRKTKQKFLKINRRKENGKNGKDKKNFQ